MPFEPGNKVGKQFSSEIQPLSNGRPKGSRSRNTIAREVLDLIATIPEDVYEKLIEIHPGIEKIMPIEKVASLAMAHRAINGDHLAYKALLDSAYGAPKQEIEHSGEVEIGFDIGKIDDNDLQTILEITQKAKND
jgi:hypothetical protein